MGRRELRAADDRPAGRFLGWRSVETLQGAPVDDRAGDRDSYWTHLWSGQYVCFGIDVLMTHTTSAPWSQTRGWHGMSREAWRRAMDSSDLAHGGVISLRTTVYAQMEEITELQSADRRRQRVIRLFRTLTVGTGNNKRDMVPLQGLVATLQGQVTDLQGQVMTLQGQVTTLQGQQGPAGGPAQPELPEEAGSSS
ncbi:hypothetical protein Tco_0316730 [Tanacetum coccineum]